MDNVHKPIKRSMSTGNLSEDDHHDYIQHDNRANSESSLDIHVEIDASDADSDAPSELYDSGIGKNEEAWSIVEKKLNKLFEKVQELFHLMQGLKLTMANIKDTMMVPEQRPCSKDNQCAKCSQDSNERARSLLDAIDVKPEQNLDAEIKNAISNFLQSDDLKDRVATTTAECVKSVISNSFTQTFPSMYMPILDSFHTRLLRYVTKILHNAFCELEGNSAYFHKSVHKTSRSIRNALEKHQSLLQSREANNNIEKTLQETLEDVLKSELAEWRQKLLNILTSQVLPKPEFPERPESPEEEAVPLSPSQPADPDKSIIEQLLKSAHINKLVKDGKTNQAFEEALSSSDLSLVMAACRAADPTRVFSPCALEQPTLLSLVQQLATDMVHDTQLKCRYLEEAIINLNPADQSTRSHLPLVVGEIRKHLSEFLQKYPSHVAGRRISLIILAADNLLK